MASSLCCRVRALSSPITRRRLPLVGAFCVLSLGFSQFCSSLSSKTGCAQSFSLAPLLSKFTSRAGSSSVRMESETSTVPSIVVYVTVPNKDEGKKLAESLVREKLAACVNRVPDCCVVLGSTPAPPSSRNYIDQAIMNIANAGVESVYQWQGEVHTDTEELLIIKTRQSLLDALTEHVQKNHSYDIPEVIALPITGGSVPYLEWIRNSTRD